MGCSDCDKKANKVVEELNGYLKKAVTEVSRRHRELANTYKLILEQVDAGTEAYELFLKEFNAHSAAADQFSHITILDAGDIKVKTNV